MTIAISRRDLSAADLREAAGRTPDVKASRRMLAIALVLEGWSRDAAAEACAMDRKTLRIWMHRFNASGLHGLHNPARRNGPLPRLSEEQQAQVAMWLAEGPKFERDGVVRWRCVDLQRRIQQQFAVTLRERTVRTLLHKLSFRQLSVRPASDGPSLLHERRSPRLHSRLKGSEA